jgi:transcriptional regulator with XRE-family HTH domain
MQQLNFLGKEIRKLRKETGQSLIKVSGSLNIERSHLNKIELGAYKPSLELLNRILDHFSVEGIKANQLRDLLQHGQVERMVVEGIERKDNKHMNQAVKKPEQVAQISIDPAANPVLFSDSILVSSSDYGLVLDVAQKVGNGPQHHIVARIGISFDHAKKLLEVISDHIQKYER